MRHRSHKPKLVFHENSKADCILLKVGCYRFSIWYYNFKVLLIQYQTAAPAVNHDIPKELLKNSPPAKFTNLIKVTLCHA